MSIIATQIATHMRQVHFGGNWTGSCMKDTLSDITDEELNVKLSSFNTIAVLVFHINYYVKAALMVLHDEPLNAHDKDSFNLPPIHSQEEWQRFLDEVWRDAEHFAELVEQLPDSRLTEIFVKEKHGNYQHNLMGVVEHTHYHLGQIVILKKLIRESAKR